MTRPAVRLKRNPNYWGRKGSRTRSSSRSSRTADTMVQALKNGDIDYARAVRTDAVRSAEDPGGSTIKAGKSNGWIELGFNSYGTETARPSKAVVLDQGPPGHGVPRALGYAIDSGR